MKKSELFDIGVSAFQRVTGKTDELYVCPLCGKGFFREDLNSGILTLEHVPPEAQNGKGIVLTCKECNSSAGYTVDAAVTNRNQQHNCIEALLKKSGVYDGRAILEMGGENINVQLSANKGSVVIIVPKEINHPNRIQLLWEHFKELTDKGTWNGEEFKITPNVKYHHQLSQIGDLRTAYLLCFVVFGYKYTFSKQLDVVRQQIIKSSERIIEGFWIFSGWDNQGENAMYFLEHPFEAIAVRLGRAIVILPSLTGPENIYQYMKENYQSGQTINFQGKIIPWPKKPEMGLDFMQFQNKKNKFNIKK